MPVDIIENEFYVCLLSNNSTEFYPENTLSAFTNALARPCKLNEKWYVGLTEISFPHYKTKEINPRKVKRHIAIEDENGKKKIKLDTPADQLKNSREQDREKSKILSIKVTDTVRLEWTKESLEQASYKKGQVNFSAFLLTFYNAVTPSWYTMYLDDIKRLMFDRLEADFFDEVIPEIKYEQEPDEFVLHIYQGKKVSENVILKYKNYETVEDFVDDIIGQIPKNKRRHVTLQKSIDDYSHPPLSLKKEREKKKSGASVKVHDYLELRLEELQATIKVKKPLPSHLNVRDLVTLFVTNIQFDDQTISEQEKQKKTIQIKDTILNILNRLHQDSSKVKPITQRKITGQSNVLDVPYEKDKSGQYLTTPVPIDTNIDNLSNFFTDVFLQTPEDKRKSDVILAEIRESFDAAGLRQDHSSILDGINDVQKSIEELSQRFTRDTQGMISDCSNFNIIYVYTDIIKPRDLGNKLVRYLRIIPLKECENILRFQHIEYCPVEKTFIENISVKLTDGQGDLIYFKESYIPTHLMLHFKRQ